MALLQLAQPAIGIVLGRLGSFLEEEAAAIKELGDELQAIKDTLVRIQCFLKDADGQSGGGERMRNRVNEIIQVAYEIEDILDTFFAEVGRYYSKNDLKGKAKRYGHMPKELVDRLKISSRIKKVKKKMDEIFRSKEEFDIRGIDERAGPGEETSRLWERRRRDAYEEDQTNDVVGLDKEINELVKQLVGGEARRCVISVVGQAGLGKTVLARKVYDGAKSSFYHSVWIHVSKHRKVKEVLRELCKAVLSLSRDEIKQLDEEEMRGRTARKLKGMKYLVVLDDVWTPEAWDDMKGALPDGEMWSRVLMTTQNERVAKHADMHTSPYKLRFLNERESYNLLCRKAFPRFPHVCPDSLTSLVNQIVERCGGLPLALVNIGGILSWKEPTPQAWRDVVDGFKFELTETKSGIACILALSFDDLPYYLKSCLLYCCAFPGDSEIRVQRLLGLWIAEGLMQKEEEKKLEVFGKDYLLQLVERSLIQPCKQNCFGQIKSCRVQGVLSEMLVATAEKQNFFQVHLVANSKFEVSKCRRLAIHHRLEQKKSANLHQVRSFISFEKSESTICYDPIIHNFELLKVLDLEGVRGVKKLPNAIGELVLLRYLGLRHTSIETLPRSTKKLCNLQTLDLRTSANFRLGQSKVSLDLKAKHVKKMTNLRHLYFGNRRGKVFKAMEVPDHFVVKGAFTELQTLSYVKAGCWVEDGLRHLSNLKKLGMQVIDGYRSGSTLRALAEMGHIHSLYLQGELEDLPTDAFRNLTKLTLDSSCLSKDPFLGLRTLPSLKSLSLINNAYGGRTMSCSVGGFPSLEVLNLEKLEHLEDMLVDSGAPGQLKFMRIAACKNLEKVPKGLEKVTLRELKLIDMEAILVDRVQRGEGRDWHIIKHIQSIIITTSAVEREFDVAQLD